MNMADKNATASHSNNTNTNGTSASSAAHATKNTTENDTFEVTKSMYKWQRNMEGIYQKVKQDLKDKKTTAGKTVNSLQPQSTPVSAKKNATAVNGKDKAKANAKAKAEPQLPSFAEVMHEMIMHDGTEREQCCPCAQS
jgi:hypothetical protein